ncbi:MAG: RNA polymerase sigma factor [Candidatus Omnitrophica bacterium]|nr:RNA polymerase sigma factor [Candidatus Omnitrophota bacterium]
MQEITNDLLKLAADGDMASFKKLYEASASFVYNVAFRVVGRHEDAQEVTQEVFLTAFHKLKEFRYQSSFKTWVYRVTVNQAINYAKKNVRQNQTMEYDENVNAVEVPSETRQKMDQEAREKLAQELLNQLNPDQRACIVLRNLEGLSYQQMAEALGININTVRTRLKRAREALMALGKEVTQNEV